ncbi:MAG: class I SAM-dependent rRNA methyltransferase [Candidatus Egerieousia sp.]|nr:class I SAM-dependent rRNA methyltransferase [Candidatus Egerieousia sp.]
MDEVYLKKGKGESLKRFHPWVFSGAVEKIVTDGNLKEGDVVEVYSSQREFMGIGHYQVGSIAVRILSFTRCKIDFDFWRNALMQALLMRRKLGLALQGADVRQGADARHPALAQQQALAPQPTGATTAYRLVHGEGDMLPGLIIDIYDCTAVIQAHSAGMFRAKEEICRALLDIYGSSLEAVYDKSSGTAPYKAGLDLNDGYLYRAADYSGDSADSFILENGNKFYVNWVEGQKTGFFLDQRNNRELVRRYAKGKRVLNLFCYTGGFSIYALAGGALSVDSVDCSKRAIELANANVALNFPDAAGTHNVVGTHNVIGTPNIVGTHNGICEDAMDFLRNVEPEKYDLMIVDPPAFAKHRGALDNALRAYKRLNAAAISKVAKGGLVFTFSCSQVVDKNDFALAVFSAAAMSGRRVKILHRLTQPEDHPVNIYHPEGEYLKGLVLYVE